MDIKATPKFFDKKYPGEVVMELEVTKSFVDADNVLLFLRRKNAKGRDSRVRLQLTKQQARILSQQLSWLAAA